MYGTAAKARGKRETMAKTIMIQGTMSNVGKSLIAAGLCRIFKQDGYRVAPFKSQNMALNAYITKENLEMGRAQAVQAEACGIEPDVCMNPILLKPTTDMGSQVILNGKVIGNMQAVNYFKKKREYIPIIQEAYNKLAAAYDIIVIEGAGSPAEINLKQDDIVNMGMAEMADAPVLLVGDIDRGGVFAQIIGTVMLLEKKEQERVKGIIVNKFRGDKKILEPGITMLEERCNRKVLGVVPYTSIDIEDEDSLAESLLKRDIRGAVDIVVIRLPHISNFTDFQAFALEEDVTIRYVDKVSKLGMPDVIFLPGTKNTIQDMRWLREAGFETEILKHFKRGCLIFGICGGYQMLGESIKDVCGAECLDSIHGIGLLPMYTIFEGDKTRSRVEGFTRNLDKGFEPLSNKKISGYEMHMGKTIIKESQVLLLDLNDSNEVGSPKQTDVDRMDGCYQKNVAGSYVHGLFDEDDFRSSFVKMLCSKKGIVYQKNQKPTYHEYKELQYDKLAEVLRENLDMEKIYEIIGID